MSWCRGAVVALVLSVAGGVLAGCDRGGGFDRDAGPHPDELDCQELLTEWQTRVYQATLPFCDRDGDCLAVGQIGEACEGNHLVGYDAVHRATYQAGPGPAYQDELAGRCRDHDNAWVDGTPAIISRCRANRCEMDFDGACLQGGP